MYGNIEVTLTKTEEFANHVTNTLKIEMVGKWNENRALLTK